MESITIKSILSDTTICMDASQPIAQVLEVMSSNLISSVVIVDEQACPIGIFTEHDALRTVAEAIDLQKPLSKVMTPNPLCVEETLNIHDAYTVMENKGYRHLVVINALKEFVGVVSEGDFIRHISFKELNTFSRISDIISSSPLIIQTDTSIVETASLMKNHKCDYAIVLDMHTHPIGLITERDIAQWRTKNKETVDEAVVSLLRVDFKVIKENIFIHEAVAQMKKHGVHQLIVVDDSQALVGMVSRHDLLHAIHGSYFEHLIKSIEHKNETISNLDKQKNELNEEKKRIELNSLKYLKLFEALPDGVVVLNIHTMQAVEFNSAAHNYLGYTAEEFAALKVSDYEQIDTPQEIERRINTILRDGFASFKTIHRKKNGEIIDVWVNVSAIELDKKPFLLAIYRDVSELKSAERDLLLQSAQLKEQKAFLYTLINTIPDLIWIKDTNGVYLACNEMFERLYNAKEAEIVGKTDFDFVDAELATFFREHDKAAIIAGGSRVNEEFLKFSDGSYEGYFETIKTPMKNGAGGILGVIGVARDLSDRKHKDEEIDTLQALAHIGTWEWDIKNDEFSGSLEAYKIFGIDEKKKIPFSDVLEHFAPEDRTRVQYQLFEDAKVNSTHGSLYKVNDKSGSFKWIKTHTEFQYDEAKNPIKALGIFEDFTEQIEHENQIIRKDNDIGSVQKLAKIGSWRFDIVNNTLEWSDETYRIFGIAKEKSLTYEAFLKCIHPEDLEKVKNAWNAALTGVKYEIEHRIIVNHETKWVREHARLELNERGKFSSGIGLVQDITEQKLYEEKLEVLANYDSLTGLANRTLFMARLQKAIEGAKRNKTQIALLMFDLDRFKDVNDSYGHSSGDELLQHIATTFVSRLKDGDIVGRIGGDEFAVVLENLSYPEDAGRFAEEMIHTLSLEFKLSGKSLVHIGVSAGIALYPEDGENASDLLQHSDAALYKSKGDGRGTYSYYTDELTQLARKRIECENDLRQAIEQNEFEVYFQPQVHMLSGRILGAEALVRWNHPQRGLVSPIEFIPIAEELGLISSIGEWVLNETCRQGKIWLDSGYHLTLAVNVSAHQVRFQNIPQLVEKALKKNNYPANHLEIELTESALMQREEETVEMLHLLRAKGIRLAIDDFGTGYSSLSYLKRFPIDVLKIDKSFVDDIPYDMDDMAIVSAIIAMGQALGFQLLAEGVEREDQMEFLKEKGCTMYQGYIKSRPVPALEFEKLLQEKQGGGNSIHLEG